MSQIASINPVGQGIQSTTSNRFSDLSSEDFIRIIFTELSNQDPFQPNDSSALLDQLNSIRSIESDIQLTERLQDLVFENQLAGASNMLGNLLVKRQGTDSPQRNEQDGDERYPHGSTGYSKDFATASGAVRVW